MFGESLTLKQSLSAEQLSSFNEAFLPHAYRSLNYQVLSNLVASASPQSDKEKNNQAITKILLSLDLNIFPDWFDEAKHQGIRGLNSLAFFSADWTLRALGDHDTQLREIFVTAGLLQG